MKLNFGEYNRKSNEAKERQEYSIAEQKAENEKYRIRENLNVTHCFEEEKSAFKPHKRLQFDEMLRLLRAGIIDAILTWKENRLCRNPEEGGVLIQMLQDGIIKEIRCVSTNAIYTPDSDHLVLQIHFGMANQYSRNLSKDVKRGLVHKCERKEYPRPAPIGFNGFGERGKRNIKPNAFEAPIIRELYELASTENYSLGSLIEHAEQKGLKTKRDKKLSKSHLHAILTRPTYYGYFYHNNELYEGNYEAIISKQLFDKVQKALKNRSKPKVNAWKSDWNGLAYCKDCGCAITTTNKIKHYKRTDREVTYSYLHCTHRRGNCSQPPLPADDFESQLIDTVSQITVDEDAWNLGIKLLKARHKHESEKNLNQQKHFDKQYYNLQEKLNKLVDMRADEELTRDEFMVQKEKLLKDMASIESLVYDTKSSARSWLELTEEYLNNAFQAREIMTEGEAIEKRNLIMAVGENLFLEDKRLDFKFKRPYDILLQPKYRTNMLGDRDSNPD